MSTVRRRFDFKAHRVAAIATSVLGLAMSGALAPGAAIGVPAASAVPSGDVRDWSPASAAPAPVEAVSVTELVQNASKMAEPQIVNGLWRNVAPVCVGTGTDGARVQVVYAREAGSRDRFAAVESNIRAEIARIDSVFAVSARKTGGGRQVRWVAPDCVPSIARVVVPAGTFSKSSGIDSTEKALAARGLAAKNRKYLVFADSTRLCGVSTIYKDSSAKNNANDGRNPQYARIDSGCWNSPDWSVAAHELVHTLGGVQPGAPNALGRYHCDDANDLMCYRETKETKLRFVCAPSHAGLLDCNNDDYFNTAPKKGSYLANAWNVANSSFLEKTPVLASGVGPGISAVGSGDGEVRLVAPAVPGAQRYEWSGPGIRAANRAATTATLPERGAATYRLTVEMPDGVRSTSVVRVR
ncbi:MAG: hypothetical protein Q4G51_14735 [Dermatophilus congolensis]|nr:hypothetical protein [Dermatophilus congolensis]